MLWFPNTKRKTMSREICTQRNGKLTLNALAEQVYLHLAAGCHRKTIAMYKLESLSCWQQKSSTKCWNTNPKLQQQPVWGLLIKGPLLSWRWQNPFFTIANASVGPSSYVCRNSIKHKENPGKGCVSHGDMFCRCDNCLRHGCSPGLRRCLGYAGQCVCACR